MTNSSRFLSWAAALSLMVCLSISDVVALPEDRKQPIRITADSAVRDEQLGETRYIGSVELTQGSLRITADKLILQHQGTETQLITATGSPASLRQIPEPHSAPVEASARKIEFDQSEDKVTLTEDARIEQDGATVTGAVIDYVLTEQRVTATGAPSEQNSGQRVEMVIPPSAMERSGNSEN